MINFKHLIEKINTGGQKAGKLDIKTTSLQKATEYANSKVKPKTIHDLIPDFDQNYNVSQIHSSNGMYTRSQMPVITSRDLEAFIKHSKENNVHIKQEKVKLKSLFASQKQIYFDKSFDTIVSNGIPKSKSFIQNKTSFIISADNYIADGHHRFLTGLILDPNMTVNVTRFGLKIEKLVKFGREFGDSIGNQRNN